MKSQKVLFLGMLFVALSFALPPSAMAGSKPSPESCAAVGSVALKCYDCGNPQHYVGKVAVLTSYEEAQGKKFCVKASDGKNACSAAYGVPAHRVGFYAKFKLGTGTREEYYKTTCVNNCGK